jgi:3-hydroxyisobutyrate dehydrogenase
MSAEIRKIGFIGIGHMGNPMAAQLVAKGFSVTVYDAHPDAMHAFVNAHGGAAAASLADVGQGTDAVIFMLPDGNAVRRVLFEDGLATHLASDAVAIDMGTSAPADTIATGNQLAQHGVRYLDAPVMGGVVFAKDATLDIMAGGDAAVIERCRPLFEAMGRKLYVCGKLGSGHVLKAMTNYINACALINTLEAMVIGRKFGLDTAIMTEAIDAMCNGRQHPIVKKIIPQVVTRKYGTGMTMQLIAKDVAIAVDSAKSVGAAVPLGEKTAELWAAACQQIGGARDQTEIVRYWEQATGATL